LFLEFNIYLLWIIIIKVIDLIIWESLSPPKEIVLQDINHLSSTFWTLSQREKKTDVNTWSSIIQTLWNTSSLVFWILKHHHQLFFNGSICKKRKKTNLKEKNKNKRLEEAKDEIMCIIEKKPNFIFIYTWYKCKILTC